MQVAKQDEALAPILDSNQVNGLSEDVLVLEDHGGVVLGTGRLFKASVRQARARDIQHGTLFMRCVEIPLVGCDGEVSGLWYRDIPVADSLNNGTRSDVQPLNAVNDATRAFVHDINNLLAVIDGGLHLLGRRSAPEDREAIVERIQEAVVRGAALSRRFLDGTGLPAGVSGDATSYRDIATTAQALSHSLGGRVVMNAVIDFNLWKFTAEPEGLYFALLNLCRNSGAAMPEGGVVVLSAKNIEPIAGARQGLVENTVADNGTGMPADVLSRAFDPYFTTKAAGEGTGLGLSQVRQFVERQGGAIEIESEEGSGTIVRIMFLRAGSRQKRLTTSA